MRDSIFPTRPRPTAIPEEDQRKFLAHTRQQEDGLRDAALFTLALGTGLRLQEILALNLGDVRTVRGGIRDRVRIRAEIAKRGSQGDVWLSEPLKYTLQKLLKGRKSAVPSDPLFQSRIGNRLSPRAAERAFERRQREAGICWYQDGRTGEPRFYGFHQLRHSAITRFHREGARGGVRLTQIFARHRNIASTAIYMHPSDEDLRAAVDRMTGPSIPG